ncbi:MAG: VOC family protein [Alphaproteobacteria bacterium]|nr:VOC family protein [Alphaproteobacteria bacterium]
MSGAISPIPPGYHNVTPYLVIRDAAAAIDFYKTAFGAFEVMRMANPDGRVMHAEIKIGDSSIMVTDEWPEMGARGPDALGGSPVSLYLYVEDVDAIAARAAAAGAVALRPVRDEFYGDRAGTIKDPFGHVWHIATHTEDVPPDELRRRAEVMFKG